MNPTARLWKRNIALLAREHSNRPKGILRLRTVAALLVVAMLLGLSSVVALADGLTASTPVTQALTQVTINDGPGGQTEPHISGTLVSYTDNSVSRIRYYDYATGQIGSIDGPEGSYDSISDVSGSKIVFTRVASGQQAIYVFDVNAPEAGAQEVDPQAISLRRRSSIGNGTIAWEDRGYDLSSYGSLRSGYMTPFPATPSGSPMMRWPISGRR